MGRERRTVRDIAESSEPCAGQLGPQDRSVGLVVGRQREVPRASRRAPVSRGGGEGGCEGFQLVDLAQPCLGACLVTSRWGWCG